MKKKCGLCHRKDATVTAHNYTYFLCEPCWMFYVWYDSQYYFPKDSSEGIGYYPNLLLDGRTK